MHFLIYPYLNYIHLWVNNLWNAKFLNIPLQQLLAVAPRLPEQNGSKVSKEFHFLVELSETRPSELILIYKNDSLTWLWLSQDVSLPSPSSSFLLIPSYSSTKREIYRPMHNTFFPLCIHTTYITDVVSEQEKSSFEYKIKLVDLHTYI